MRQHILPFALAMALSACSLTPALVKPDAPVPVHFPSSNEADLRANAADWRWKTVFSDPRLQRLIELALANNRDLRLAVLNVEAVQAQYGIQRSGQFPAIDVNASAARQRGDSNGTGATTGTQLGLGLGISAFEIDLFGRTRSLSDAALSRYLASEQGQKAAQITLIGAVADSYHAELLAQEQLKLAQQTLTDWQQSLDLARRLKAANQNSGLEVSQAEGQVATAEADLEARTRTRAQARNALQLLVGTAIPADLPAVPTLDELPRQALPAGLPSDLLTRRPDILQAEHNLRAANADIGAARAAFFPRLSLTTSLGYSSSEMGKLFDSGSRVWSFAPQLTVPIFNAGRLRSELRLAEVRTSSAVAEYERAIQTAFREVADGLAGRETYGRQIEAQQRVVASAAKRLALSNLRYRAGVDGRLELLDAQRQLYAARQALLDLRHGELASTVALYKALGGGVS